MFNNLTEKWKLLAFLVVFIIILFPNPLYSQQNLKTKVNLQGSILSKADSTELGGATLRVLEINRTFICDNKGHFNINLDPGNYSITFSSLGFEKQVRKILLPSKSSLTIYLNPVITQELEITVKSNRINNSVKNLEMGLQRLDMKIIKRLPSFLGEPDILHNILTLPGVSTVGEGATGFNVRGGGIDQNLILLDQQQIYNSSHLFGFFSVFNPEAVDDATLIKGGIPAQYGGRLSSILDVHMDSGNPERFSGSGGLGSISSRLALGGPLQKGKSEFFISGRRSYADLFLKLSKDSTTRKTYAYFYDLNFKLTFHPYYKDQVELSGYFGRDAVNLAGLIDFGYGNGLGGLNWKHTFNSRYKSNFNFGISNYDNSVGIPTGINGFNYQNQIFNYQAKYDLDYRADSLLHLKYGISAIRYQIQPGITKPVGDSSVFNIFSVKSQRAYEYAAYVESEQKLNPHFSVRYGLRLSAFDYRSIGNDTIYSYSGSLGQELSPVNPFVYPKGSSIKSYINLEPRLSIRYLVGTNGSLKASYNRTTQYIHLISNTTASSPFDIWATTSNNIKPEIADQVSLGYFKDFHQNRWEASAEVYYKRSLNQIDYINGAQTLLNKNLEGELLFGTGRSYGLEVYIKKNIGKLNGWLSYTLSKTERKINGINQDNWYPSKYDRTHNLALVGTYELSQRWILSGSFTFQTGITTTFPDSRYSFQGLLVPYNSLNNRNNYRLPNYNRLDLSATLFNKVKPGRKFKSNWVFSLYNVYGRRNPYSIFFRQNQTDPNKTEAVRVSILGSAVPGITWNFLF